MIRRILFISILFSVLASAAQVKENSGVKKPRLVVGIIVDQMRNDLIDRYRDRYGKGGFNRLVSQGFYFRNNHFNYIPTYTGPGHSSIYTGATPRSHGIIANDWFVKSNNGWTGCVQDNEVATVGSEGTRGQASPKNQLSSTIGDELKMNSNGRSKVFGIAVKDRGAILSAGHAANGAFWLNEDNAQFISSTWYMKELPGWLKDLNAKKIAENYLKQGWKTLYPIDTYTNSIADENNYEAAPFKEKAVFPYDFSYHLGKHQPGIIKATPYGNSITKDLALECIKQEELGRDEFTDLISISFSCTDVIMHAFGPRSVETEDTYLRLDKDIEEILNLLDKQVGKDNYVVFLTADHGGADVPNHLKDKKIPAGYIRERTLRKDLTAFFQDNYNDTLLLANISNEQIFLNEQRIAESKLDSKEIEKRICAYLLRYNGIAEAYTSVELRGTPSSGRDCRSLLQAGYNHKRSGNVCFFYEPAWMDHGNKGTTHGAGYNYDTHVPLIFMGAGIRKGIAYEYTTITQIAPSVCELLQINYPNSCVSDPLVNYFR